MAPARPDFLILGLAAAGFAIAAYLTWLKWMGGNAAFCLSGSGCDIVQGSRYGSLLGVPTALWGALMYAAIGALAALGLDRAALDLGLLPVRRGRGLLALPHRRLGARHPGHLRLLPGVERDHGGRPGRAAPPARRPAGPPEALARSCPGPWPRRSWCRSAPPSFRDARGRWDRLRGRAGAAPARDGRGDVRGLLVPALRRAEGALRRRGQGPALRGVRPRTGSTAAPTSARRPA